MHPFSITSNYNVLHYFPKNARNEHIFWHLYFFKVKQIYEEITLSFFQKISLFHELINFFKYAHLFFFILNETLDLMSIVLQILKRS